MTDQTREPVTQQQETVTKQKNPLRIEQGRKLVEYNRHKKEELGKSIINLYSNVACSVLGIGNQQELSTDLESDPFLNTALQRFTCDLYYCFGALLASFSGSIITGKHYAKNSITKLNDRSNKGTCDTATRNCNQTEEPSEN